MTLMPRDVADLAVSFPVEGKVVYDVLSQEEYELLKQGMTRVRDLLICKMLRGTGLRINELMRLQPEQVKVNGPEVSVMIRRSKRPQAVWEYVPIQPTLGVELVDWIKGNAIRPGAKVFAVSDRQVRRVFAEAGRRGIGRPVHPHELRGLYIKTMLDGGLPVAVAAKMVGHADVRTTMKHYYELTAAQRREIQRRIPV